jgi:hypothetical protein
MKLGFGGAETRSEISAFTMVVAILIVGVLAKLGGAGGLLRLAFENRSF